MLRGGNRQARSRRSASLAASLGRSPRAGFRTASASTSSDASAHVPDEPITDAVSKRRASAWNTNSLMSTSSERQNARPRWRERPLAVAAHVQETAVLGPAQPLLA